MSGATGPQSEQEIYDALAELRQEPYGAARSARTEELVDAAERLELDEALPAALLELLAAYQFGNESHKAPVLFSRVLKLYQEKPESFDAWCEHRLFWCFKWITSALLYLPEIPLSTIEGWIAKMREHYVAAGKPLQAVYTSRYHLAAHTGVDREAAYELWSTNPRDEFSDCEACEARERGIYWRDRGDDARALLEWKPVLEKEIGCAEEPASTIAHALLPLVREGRLEQAAALHRSGYRAAKAEVGMDGKIGQHLEFLALTGNGARGLELLAENRARFDSTANPMSRLRFLDGVRVLLTRLAAQGAAQAPVTGPGGRTYTVTSLLAEVTASSDELARRFDERNGTSRLGDSHRKRCAREPLLAEPLPLGLRVAPLSAAPAPSPAVVPRTQPPQDFKQLLAEAREALRLGRPDNRALWDAVARRATEADLDDVVRAELADQEAFRHVAKQEWPEAAACARRSAELFEKAGEPGRAVARRARAEWCAFLAAPAEDCATLPWSAFDFLLTAAEGLLEDGRIAPEEYIVVRHSRAVSAFRALMGAGRESVEAARARFDAENEALLESALRLGELGRAAVAEGLRSGVLAREGAAEEALAAVQRAVALVEQAERPWLLPQYLGQHGQLLNRLGRLEQAAPLLQRSLALLAEWPDENIDELTILMELAQNRLHADDYSAAITHLTKAAAKFDLCREAEDAAHARALLGQAMVRAQRLTDAVAVFESLLTEEAEAGLEAEQRAQIRLELGRALVQTGEARAAAEVFAQLADLVSGWPDQSVLTLVAAELVCALYLAQLWEQGEQAFERALEVHETAPNPAMICKMLRVAAEAEYQYRGVPGVERALELLRRSDVVNEAAEEVAGRYRRWPETALNADVRVQALGSAGRDEEALTACEQAIAAWRIGGNQTVGEYAQAVRIAAILEGDRLGRRQQAAARLSPAIARCREAGHERAVAALTRQAEGYQE